MALSLLLILIAFVVFSTTAAEQPSSPTQAKAEPPFGIPKRIPWTTSHITGTPEPPPPYKMVRAFPQLTFKNPLLLTTAPGINRFFVAEQAGKIFSFPIDPKADKADLFLDWSKEQPSWDKAKFRNLDGLYALAFHPQFVKNRYCYICYVLNGTNGQAPDGSRISRFTVSDTDPPRCDPASEKIILTWLGGGHNGCDLHFGPDGFLYISTGDGVGPNPPDTRETGQDISDLLSSILRIDVDREENAKSYAIPPDNPFIKTPNARPEVWAYGFRNPWRMSFDRTTGDLWVGDVGWESWEMIYRVKKGGNYGWSVMEGPQPVRPNGKRGPTPILPPAIAFPHTEAASITGGFVYRGKRHKDLIGTYICGDWVTRKVWGTRFKGDDIVSHRELAQGTERVVAFGEDHDKELYIVNHDEVGTILQLAPNEALKDYRGDFPKKLSDTGLFSSVRRHILADGVLNFSIRAESWADHATAERFVALPGTGTIKMYDFNAQYPDYSGQNYPPKDGVLAKTLSLEMERGNPRSRRRLETQILHYDGTNWRGYTYAWNDEQTDAVLVGDKGLDRTFTVTDAKAPGGKRVQRWHFPSRTECLTCHNPWASYTLAFNASQLNKNHDYDGLIDNQLRALRHASVVAFHQRKGDRPIESLNEPPLTNPHDGKASLQDRARSYLHVNCAHCHQFGAGGTALIDLRYTTANQRMKALEAKPVQGTFDILNAQLVAPADPYRSILYYRMAKLGGGRMPHIGSDVVDEKGLRLIHDWIQNLPLRKDDAALIEKLAALDEAKIAAPEISELLARLEALAVTFAKKNNRNRPNKDDYDQAAGALNVQTSARVKSRQEERAGLIKKLLSTTSGALMLASALGEKQVPDSVRPQILELATATSDSQVRDLFERFLPDDQRVKRLGSVIRPEQILALKGDADKGRELFFKAGALQCASCHRIGKTGSTLGPDLSDIGKKYSRGQILESILEPSKFIDPKYVTYTIETSDGKIVTGLLASKSDQEIVLNVVGDKQVRVEAKMVASFAPQQKSLMPELLFRDVTAEQAADLLEFLAGLKK